MRQVLTDVAVETEASNALWARVARSFDGAAACEHEAAVRRVAVAVAKYWNCKRAPTSTMRVPVGAPTGTGTVSPETVLPKPKGAYYCKAKLYWY